MAKWDRLISLRDDVNGVLEAARADKRIGKPLDAAVVLSAADTASEELLNEVSSMDLSDLFIVSKCLIGGDVPVGAVEGAGVRNSGLRISVFEAPGAKCPRCWIHTEQPDPETGLCPRCAEVVRKQA